MKIYVSHSSGFDYRSELYEPLRQLLGSEDMEVILPHEASDDNPLSSKEIIATCDLVLVEASYPSTGSGIELGWADMQNVPVIAMYHAGTRPSSAIKLVVKEMIEYSNVKEIAERIKKFKEYGE